MQISMQPDQHHPFQNKLLAALPANEFKRLAPDLELVQLALGQVLFKSEVIESLYFPTSAVVSLLIVLENGLCAAIAVVGNEGVIGTSLLLGSETTTNVALVQGAGWAYRLNSDRIKNEFKRVGGA
jgi:CRP-like cAMP-binding protein